MELLNAVRAECMTTVNQYAWNTLTNVILKAAELANIEPSGLVVQVHQVYSHVCTTCLQKRKKRENLFLLIIIYYLIYE